MLSVRWTEPASRALEAILDYVAKDNPGAALGVARRVRAAVEQLAEHPKIGRDCCVRGTRELVIYDIPYVVPYRIKNEEVHILSVYHASRKWPETFD